MTSNLDSETPREYEVTLAIVSNTPDRVGSEIAALSTVGRYRVLPLDLLRIRDIYLDTPAGDLRQRRWALRIRTSRESVKFALKGPASKTASGVIERPELEDTWSREAPERIMAALSAHGVPLVLRRSPGSDMPPVDTLKRAGFRVIQTRETRRELKSVLNSERELAVADLALDLVSYYFGTSELRHAEVEIEALGPETVDATKAVADYLIAAYSPELRRWDYGKLATGLALEQLLRKGSLEGLIRRDRYVEPLAYDRIIDWFNRLEPGTGQ